MVIIGPKTLRDKLDIDVMAQGHQDGAARKLTAGSVGETNDGAVL